MKGKITFAERVARSVRGNPFNNLWLDGTLLALMSMALLLVAVGGTNRLVFWIGGALFLAYFGWLALLIKWGRVKFLRRVGQRRRRAEERHKK